MAQEPQPDPAAESLQIDTPIIDIQDLEHNPGPSTRVSNKGVKIEPRMDSVDDRDFLKEDEAALEALAQFEKSLRGLLSG